MSFEKIKKGVVKRKARREIGLFIDGTGLDRATRRLNRKVDMPKLVRGVTAGGLPTVARYYTLIPYEDDSRQRAFLDAVRRANLQVIVKRLPPKGVSRQVSVDLEIAADIVAFSLGHQDFSSLNEYQPVEEPAQRNVIRPGQLASNSTGGAETNIKRASDAAPKTDKKTKPSAGNTDSNREIQRIVTIVCPSRELTYPISLINELGVDTVTADFGQFNNKDLLKSAAKWIDLSDSETIWRG